MIDHNIFVSSSSSSSDSDDEAVFVNIVLPEIQKHRQKMENYFENIVPNYKEDEFIEHFRVSREVIISLAQKYEESVHFPKSDTGNERISSDKCMLIFCWYAGHEAASFRDVADRFDISISTLHIIIRRISHFLSGIAGEIIKWPSEVEAREIEINFSLKGFPGVIGCMDGTHIRIDKPAEDSDSYINRNKYYSIQMQLVCDHRRSIRDVFIGYPGSVHDSRVFKTSPLYHLLERRCGDNIILADSAYPCLRNVLTPYRDNGHLTPIEIYYNQKLSSCRITVEHTFGILKQKFRQLYHLKLRPIEDMCHFIRACFVLHNLSIDNDILLMADEPNRMVIENGQILDNGQDIDDEPEDEGGQEYRNYIATLLYN